MSDKVYAVFHDGNGHVLLGKKNMKGYYFHNNGGGKIIAEGVPLYNAGKWVFPGGGLEGGDVAEGALKEFGEETDIHFDEVIWELEPGRFKGKATIGGNEYTYYGVYFKVEASILESLVNDVNKNLLTGQEAADAVIKGNGYEGGYSQLQRDFKNCPWDNELEKMEIWRLDDALNEWENDDTVDWLYNILFNLQYE